MNIKKRMHPAWVIFIGTCLMSICGYGLAASTGGIYYPVVTADLGISYTQLNATVIAMTLAMMVCMPIAGKLVGKVSVKLVSAVSVIAMASAFFVQAAAHSLPLIYFGKVLMGIGGSTLMGMLANIMLSTWFRTKLATVMGIMTAIGGFSAALWNPLISWIVVSNGWRVAMVVSGFIILLVLLPVSLFMLKMPSSTSPAYGEIPIKADALDQSIQPSPLEGIPFKQARRMPVFYMLAMSSVFLTCISVMLQQSYTQAISLGYSLIDAGMVVSSVMLGSGICKLLMGVLLDKLKPKVALPLYMLLGVGGLLGLIYSPNLNLLLISGALMGATTSMSLIGAPYIIRSVFGRKDYSRIYSSFSTMSSLVLSFAMIPIGMIYDQLGNYNLYIFICIFFLVTSTFSLLGAYAHRLEKADSPKSIQTADTKS